MGQDSTRKPSKPTKLSNACLTSDDVPVSPATLGAMLQELNLGREGLHEASKVALAVWDNLIARSEQR